VEFKPSIPVFERAKTFYALDRAATVIGYTSNISHKIQDHFHVQTCFTDFFHIANTVSHNTTTLAYLEQYHKL
jgi:hypothetical protein